MYGLLLESVQHYVIEECGEEVWDTIIREAGARNLVFSATQQYPDTLMLRLACALARLVSAPAPAAASSPAPRKRSLHNKPSWRSASVHNDGRAFRCPFTATNALTEATKKEINAFNSSEEIRTKTLSNSRINEEPEEHLARLRRQSARLKSDAAEAKSPVIAEVSDDTEVKFESLSEVHDDEREVKFKSLSEVLGDVDKVKSQHKEVKPEVQTKEDDHKSPEVRGEKEHSPQKRESLPARKHSCTGALDVCRRRGSAPRARLNSLTLAADRRDALRERFGTPEKVMHFFGRCFVKFFSNYGYDKMLRATGRYFCTFLQSVDSIHQRMRFTFPRIRSPTMQLTRAHKDGAELVYSSERVGFTHYLMGQLYEIAEDMFSLRLRASVVREAAEESGYVAVLRLEFDNNNYVMAKQALMLRRALPCPLQPVPSALLLQLFPFGAMIDRRMQIIRVGDKLLEAWGGPMNRLKNASVGDILRLRKPKISSFSWEKVVSKQTMVFELELVRWRGCAGAGPGARRGSQGTKAVLLKGPIYLLQEIDVLIFLCSPIFNDLEELSQAGLYLNDLNGHGLSKEMLLEGWQHLSRLELLFENAEKRSQSLENSCRLLDQWKKRGDQLLYSMIPKSIAAHLRDGKDPFEACQAFDAVSVLFCGVPGCGGESRAGVMQAVAAVNEVYSRIDRLLDAHRVYKVETVGTVYMVVSGAPVRRRSHAAEVASAALAIIQALPGLTIGIHSGPCVAGVLGRRVPRYCLVGDTVNTASRMQTTSEPGRIQISATTAAQLPARRFRVRRRGLTTVKGKGVMETSWLEGENEEDEQQEALQLFSALCGDN